LAQDVTKYLKDQCKGKNVPLAEIEIIQGDILEVDWFEADILYFSNVCFNDLFQETVTNLMEKLKVGSRIICLKELPERPYLKKIAAFGIQMSWNVHKILVYHKV
jgi:predicted nicotinamide N-methyase